MLSPGRSGPAGLWTLDRHRVNYELRRGPEGVCARFPQTRWRPSSMITSLLVCWRSSVLFAAY